MTQDPWQAYLQALNAVHGERDQAARGGRLDQQARAARAATLEEYGGRLAAQREELRELAGRLRAPLAAQDVAPGPAGPLGWQAGVEDLEGRLRQADDAAADSRRIGRLPQLLPAWRGRLARSLVVLIGLSLPNAAFTTALSQAGVTGSNSLLIWFVLGFPLVLMLGGGALLSWLSSPRIGPDDLDGQLPAAPQPRWRYRMLAVPIAWASWLVPGILLDVMPLHP